MAYIYKVTNTVNGKMYIGQTTRTIEQRWKQHVYNSFKDSPFDKGMFHCAIKKYGPEAFVVEQVEECREKDLNNRETFWIKELGTNKSGYNMTLGGDHPIRCDGEEVVALWNDGLAVKEIADKLGISRRMVSERLDGNGVGISDKKDRGAKISGKTKRLPIYLYDREGNFVAEYDSLQDAKDAIGYKSNINNPHCYTCTVGGYQWRRYKADKLDNMVSYHEHEVHQYTMDGDYVATYKSLKDAAIAVNGNEISGRNIGGVCRGGRRYQAYGFRWSFDKVEKLPPLSQSKKCRPVVRISDDGKERKEYCSAAEAGRENGVSANAILDTCMGKQQHSAGYRWEYAGPKQQERNVIDNGESQANLST